MFKRMKILKITALSVAGALLLFAGVISAADPGSNEDPLISLSYIEKQLMPMIESYVEARLARHTGGVGTSVPAASFTVVEVKSGESLIGAAGCELILRQGSARVISTLKGGLADTTVGVDLPNDSIFPSNHLLIVPLGDGRGLKADSDLLVMVKGSYSIY